MKHRERVMAALSHEEPDRCPMQVSFTPEFAARLRKEVKIDAASRHNPHGRGNTYALERMRDVVSFFDATMPLYEQLRRLPNGPIQNLLRVTATIKGLLE